MTRQTDSVTIRLPTELRTELEARIDETEFESLEAYVLFVLREIVEDDERAEASPDADSADLEGRLEDLGYL